MAQLEAGWLAMLNRMRALVCSNNMCVLATARENRPHCSLMAYVTDERCREVYMVTRKDSHKYKNLAANRCVSLLIDTRAGGPREKIQALTVSGRFEAFKDQAAADTARMRLLSAHPHLEVFVTDAQAIIVRIVIESFLLLDGLDNAYFETC